MRLSIATGNTGGVYYPYGGGLARIISHSLPRVDATAEVTAAIGRQPEADSAGQGRHRLHLRRHAGRRAAGARAVSARRPVRARTLAMLYPELHPDRDARGQQHQSARRPARPGRLHRFAGQRHRSHRAAAAARRRSRPGSGPPPAGAVGQRIGRRAQGRQDRRVLLDRRPADRVASSISPAPSASGRSCCPTTTCCRRCSGTTGRRSTSGWWCRAGTYPGMTSDVGVVGVANLLVVHEAHERGPRLRPDPSAVREAARISPRSTRKAAPLARDRHRGLAGAVPSRRDALLP